MNAARRGVLYVAAAIVAIPPLLLILFVSHAPSAATVEAVAVKVIPVARSAQASGAPAAAGDLFALGQRDPLALARMGEERYERDVRDYRCLLVKQERIEGKLSALQEAEVRFRKDPRAVYMIWHKNPGEAKRALFKPGDPAYRDEQGNPQALVEPAGAVVRLFVKDIYMPIHGERAKKASRRTIDECGFGSMFDLLEQFNALAAERGEMDVRFTGVGEVDGRSTFVIERYLPYTGEGGRYPDAKMVLHLDQEWLLPVGVESYADAAGQELLGRYLFTKIELNPGLTERDFQF